VIIEVVFVFGETAVCRIFNGVQSWRGGYMLSDVDIKKKLKKKNIAIAPFNSKNVEGASIYVTASAFAWSLKDRNKISNSSGQIIIPANDTGMIVTTEKIYVDLTTAGVCLSRVGMVSKGVRHVGAPIKPGYAGRLIISIQNPRKDDFPLRVGEPIAVVMLHELKTRATIDWSQNENGVFFNLSETVDMGETDKNELIVNSPCKNKIIKSMEESQEYIDYVTDKGYLQKIKNIGAFVGKHIASILTAVVVVVIGEIIVHFLKMG